MLMKMIDELKDLNCTIVIIINIKISIFICVHFNSLSPFWASKKMI